MSVKDKKPQRRAFVLSTPTPRYALNYGESILAALSRVSHGIYDGSVFMIQRNRTTIVERSLCGRIRKVRKRAIITKVTSRTFKGPRAHVQRTLSVASAKSPFAPFGLHSCRSAYLGALCTLCYSRIFIRACSGLAFAAGAGYIAEI